MAEAHVFSYGVSAAARLDGHPWNTASVIDERNMRMEH